MSATHEVSNQAPPLDGYNAFTRDPLVQAAVRDAGVEWIAPRARSLGAAVGSEEGQQLAASANRNPPELHTHDRFGRRIDSVEYHPSYHALMVRAIGAGVHSAAWGARAGGFSARAVLFHLWNQLEQGTSCPVTMSFASVPLLRRLGPLGAAWEAKLLANAYDPRPLGFEAKTGVTIGMAMTEKQGGSDLRAVQTVARACDAEHFLLTGHKWFCSAPMSDAFFTLARLPENGKDQGVSCFFVPRSLPDGTRNTFLIQRLKEKVGNRSNASAEIEYRDTLAWRVGEPGRGIPTLIEMAHLTRFDIVVGTAGMMRSALDHAVHHARHREAFGKKLADHALMANVLADLALESQAASLLAFRLARAFDATASNESERAVQRLLTPVAKFWHCKRLTPMTVEAMEVLGGNGYVEESVLARLYREAPLNGIWEGSGNVICLDVMRSVARAPEGMQALLHEMGDCGDARVAQHARKIGEWLVRPQEAEPEARRIVEAVALGMQASLMSRFALPQAAEAFIGSRLCGEGGHAFGTLPSKTPYGRVLDASFMSL